VFCARVRFRESTAAEIKPDQRCCVPIANVTLSTNFDWNRLCARELARVALSLFLSQHERANNIHAPLYALCNTIVLINTKRYMLLVFTYNQNYTRSAVNVHMRGAKWDERVFGPGVDFNGRAGGCRRKKWHRMRAKNTSSAPLQCYVCCY
jgi:hypothetical protein